MQKFVRALMRRELAHASSYPDADCAATCVLSFEILSLAPRLLSTVMSRFGFNFKRIRQRASRR